MDGAFPCNKRARTMDKRCARTRNAQCIVSAFVRAEKIAVRVALLKIFVVVVATALVLVVVVLCCFVF